MPIDDFRDFSPSHAANRAFGEECCERFYDCAGSCLSFSLVQLPFTSLYISVQPCESSVSVYTCIERRQKRETRTKPGIWSRCSGTALIFSVARSSLCRSVREYASSVTSDMQMKEEREREREREMEWRTCERDASKDFRFTRDRAKTATKGIVIDRGFDRRVLRSFSTNDAHPLLCAYQRIVHCSRSSRCGDVWFALRLSLNSESFWLLSRI